MQFAEFNWKNALSCINSDGKYVVLCSYVVHWPWAPAWHRREHLIEKVITPRALIGCSKMFMCKDIIILLNKYICILLLLYWSGFACAWSWVQWRHPFMHICILNIDIFPIFMSSSIDRYSRTSYSYEEYPCMIIIIGNGFRDLFKRHNCSETLVWVMFYVFDSQIKLKIDMNLTLFIMPSYEYYYSTILIEYKCLLHYPHVCQGRLMRFALRWRIFTESLQPNTGDN